MTALAWLIPAALALGGAGLAAFLWALNDGQFEDLDGAAWRAIDDEPRKRPDAHAIVPGREQPAGKDHGA
jgi:cbb3-type cytochrome oxidase maturation protein